MLTPPPPPSPAPSDAPRGSGIRRAEREAAETQAALSWRQRVGALRNVPPLLRLVWQTSPALTTANLLPRLVRAFLPVAMLYVGKLTLDEVVRIVNEGFAAPGFAEAVRTGELSHLLLLVAAEFGLAFLSEALARAVSLTDALLGDLFTNATSVKLMAHAATLDLEHFEDPELQDNLERARRQTTGRMTLVSTLFEQAQDVLTVASLAAGLVVLAPWLILLLAVALIPAFLGEAHFNAQGYSLTRAWTPERRQLDYLRQVGASAETAKEVKVFGLNAYLTERYRVLADAFYAANRGLAIRRAAWGGLLGALGSLGYFAAYGWIAVETARGRFSIGDLTFLAGSFARLRGLLEGLLSRFSSVASQALYLDDLFAFFEIQPSITSPDNPRPFPVPMQTGFVFENVGFKYPGPGEKWAVRGLSFELHAGEVIALVGENGAGKTTLVKLLARLYDPDEGRILLDGHDLREYDLDDLRSHIGVIFQDFVRYHFTARDNIAVGRIEARDDLPRIEQAAELGLADAVIESLPLGYDQVLGKRFREGVDLSGGQWQKIAIARAYMRDADVLILDEPTSALDARAEYEVFVRFKRLIEGRTAVLISHRFSTVRMADRILVLDQGRVIESGSHEALMAQKGRYAELFDLQAAGYR
ncbi:MAG: ABC transporter ATP-binding protein/permease [Bacteroidetes bacterium]|nr:ABC transporter ATP-binding protein/permease [Bacteroidota bacterium]